MHSALDKVKEFIERNKMLRDRHGVVVAVSGGADSVALLDILKQISSIGDERPRLHIAHLNHKLRGSESADDAEFVRRLAERFGFPFTISEADVRLAAETANRGIEEIARELRYNFLLGVARESDCDSIATGHTMSDQAKTFLMRVARGAGLRGLAAMRPISPVPVFDNAAAAEGGVEGETGRGGAG
jgi:tRNA(Ile)-lysidine synthase